MIIDNDGVGQLNERIKSPLEHLFNKYQIVITHRNYKNYDPRYKSYILKEGISFDAICCKRKNIIKWNL